jgi:hypothetical protein
LSTFFIDYNLADETPKLDEHTNKTIILMNATQAQITDTQKRINGAYRPFTKIHKKLQRSEHRNSEKNKRKLKTHLKAGYAPPWKQCLASLVREKTE